MPQTIVFIPGNDPSKGLGGHSCYVRTMARTAVALGFEPHIFCVAAEDGVARTDYGVIHCCRTPVRPFRHNMMPLNARRLGRAVADFLSQKAGPHLIHGFFVWSYAGVLAARELRRRGVEAVVVATTYDTFLNEVCGKVSGMEKNHGLFFRATQLAEVAWSKLVVDPREKIGYENAARIFFNYDSVGRLLTASYGLGPTLRKLPYTSETAMLPEPASVPETFARFRARGVPLIVTASRHDPRKGIHLLLRVLARLRHQGLEFRVCMVGGGELLESHRKLSRQLGLEDIVSIEGFVPNSYAFIKHADIFALPSSEEGSGSLSLIEALQAGVPVVASDVDGIPEDVTNEDSALLVQPGDADALACALSRLIRDGVLRARLARRARETFEEKFSPDALKAALKKNYAELGFGIGPRQTENSAAG
jgi:glycosyltransferase involved in cell wall biosynthesis